MDAGAECAAWKEYLIAKHWLLDDNDDSKITSTEMHRGLGFFFQSDDEIGFMVHHTFDEIARRRGEDPKTFTMNNSILAEHADFVKGTNQEEEEVFILAMFSLADIVGNDNGVFEADEMVGWIAEMRDNMEDMGGVNAMFDKIDSSDNGEISKQEYTDWVDNIC